MQMTRNMLGVAAFVAILTAAGSAAAQPAVPETGGRVYGLAGGGFGDGPFVASGAGAGLRLTRHLGLDVELTHLTARGSTTGTPFLPLFGDIPGFVGGHAEAGVISLPSDHPPFPFPLSFERGDRDVTAFLTKFTVEFPIADGRLFPYLTGGGGVGRVTESPFFFIPLPIEQANLGLALTLGGGVDVRLWRGFGIGVDIRWLRVLHSYDTLDTAQVAGRASYRF
jgi:hypothetical protein